VNELLEAEGFDEFAEKECARFYAESNGRPSLAPGIYFRLLLVGYFEGIDSERGIAWRAADSIGLREHHAGVSKLAQRVSQRNGRAKRISRTGLLRIQVDVPQSEAVNIQIGQKALLDVKERLGREYTGTVVRNASSLDAAARTMLTEVQVDNRDGSLLPGMYAQVRFTLSQARPSLIIPMSSLVIDRSGMHVVTVSRDGRVHFAPVTIGKDMGYPSGSPSRVAALRPTGRWPSFRSPVWCQNLLSTFSR
jgi:hypothetical protein